MLTEDNQIASTSESFSHSPPVENQAHEGVNSTIQALRRAHFHPSDQSTALSEYLAWVNAKGRQQSAVKDESETENAKQVHENKNEPLWKINLLAELKATKLRHRREPVPTATVVRNSESHVPTVTSVGDRQKPVPTATVLRNSAFSAPTATVVRNSAFAAPTATVVRNSAFAAPTATVVHNSAFSAPTATVVRNSAFSAPTATVVRNSAFSAPTATVVRNSAFSAPTATAGPSFGTPTEQSGSGDLQQHVGQRYQPGSNISSGHLQQNFPVPLWVPSVRKSLFEGVPDDDLQQHAFNLIANELYRQGFIFDSELVLKRTVQLVAEELLSKGPPNNSGNMQQHITTYPRILVRGGHLQQHVVNAPPGQRGHPGSPTNSGNLQQHIPNPTWTAPAQPNSYPGIPVGGVHLPQHVLNAPAGQWVHPGSPTNSGNMQQHIPNPTWTTPVQQNYPGIPVGGVHLQQHVMNAPAGQWVHPGSPTNSGNMQQHIPNPTWTTPVQQNYPGIPVGGVHLQQHVTNAPAGQWLHQGSPTNSGNTQQHIPNPTWMTPLQQTSYPGIPVGGGHLQQPVVNSTAEQWVHQGSPTNSGNTQQHIPNPTWMTPAEQHSFPGIPVGGGRLQQHVVNAPAEQWLHQGSPNNSGILQRILNQTNRQTQDNITTFQPQHFAAKRKISQVDDSFDETKENQTPGEQQAFKKFALTAYKPFRPFE